MGIVYRARDTLDDKPCAIKEFALGTLPDENEITQPRNGENTLARGDHKPEITRQDAIKQFKHEAKILRKLDHLNLPKVSDYFQEGEEHYLVVELIEGQDLDTFLKDKGDPLPLGEVLQWISQVMDALIYCHKNKIIHRDIKPSNIRLTPEGKIYLMDFGLAKLDDPNQVSLLKNASTPGYRPPEQRGENVHTDTRSDIYALGATMYALLTNSEPLDAEPRKIYPLKPPRELAPHIPQEIEAVILKAMELEADKRFQSVKEMMEALFPVKPKTPSPPAAKRKPPTKGNVVTPSISKVKPTVARPEKPLNEWKLSLDGKGGFSDLATAVAALPAGATLQIEPGDYDLREPLVIRKSLTLVGKGKKYVTVFGDLHPALVLIENTDNISISGITFQQYSSSEGNGLITRNSNIFIENCCFLGNPEVSTNKGSGIWLQEGGQPKILKCTVSNNQVGIRVTGDIFQGFTLRENICNKNDIGIEISGQSDGLAVENTCADNTNGIVVNGAAHPELAGNICETNKEHGIVFSEQSTGKASINTCSQNHGSGIAISGTAAPVLYKNTCQTNHSHGIFYTLDSTGKAHKNLCTGNSKSGLMISGQAHPMLEENTCNENIEFGITYIDKAWGSAVKNYCNASQKYGGIQICDHAHPEIIENTCEKNNTCGILVTTQVECTIKKNICGFNKTRGISIQDSARPMVEENQCSQNTGSGIVYYGQAKGTAKLNTCERSKEASGITVNDAASPELIENCCQGNKVSGIYYGKKATGKAFKNRCSSNSNAGIVVIDEATPTLVENSCYQNLSSGIAYYGKSSGTASHNTCSESKEKSGIELNAGALPVLIDNICQKNALYGISYSDNSGGRAINNLCSQNKYSGIRIGNKAVPSLEMNICNDNAECGMIYFSEAGGTAIKNTCCDNQKYSGIQVGGTAQPQLIENSCQGNKTQGITYLDNAQGTARQNRCEENNTSGIEVSDLAKPILVENDCSNNLSSGIVYYGKAAGIAQQNICRGSKKFHGIQVNDDAHPELNENICQGNQQGGITYFNRATGRAWKNECSANQKNGISLYDETRPILDDNNCFGNKDSGIFITDSCQATIQGNLCEGIIQPLPTAHQKFDIQGGETNYEEVATISSPEGNYLGEFGITIEANIGRLNPSVTALGVWLFDSQSQSHKTKILVCSYLQNNKLLRTELQIKGDLIEIQENTDISFETDNFLLNAQVHVSLNDLGTRGKVFSRITLYISVFQKSLVDPRIKKLQATLMDLSYFGSQKFGIKIASSARPTLLENRCTGNRDTGIIYTEHSGGEARKNHSYQNQLCGIAIVNEARPTLAENTCIENQGSGLAFFDQSGGQAIENDCSRNGSETFKAVCRPGQLATLATLFKESLPSSYPDESELAGHGIQAMDQAQPQLIRNTCQDNLGYGLWVNWETRLRMKFNHSSGNKKKNLALVPKPKKMRNK